MQGSATTSTAQYRLDRTGEESAVRNCPSPALRSKWLDNLPLWNSWHECHNMCSMHVYRWDGMPIAPPELQNFGAGNWQNAPPGFDRGRTRRMGILDSIKKMFGGGKSSTPATDSVQSAANTAQDAASQCECDWRAAAAERPSRASAAKAGDCDSASEQSQERVGQAQTAANEVQRRRRRSQRRHPGSAAHPPHDTAIPRRGQSRDTRPGEFNRLHVVIS